MSYKLNRKDPSRRVLIMARRDVTGIPYAPTFKNDKYGNKVYVAPKKSPAYVKNIGLLTHKSKRNMMRVALRRKLPDHVLESIYLGTATKASVYGKHPTRG